MAIGDKLSYLLESRHTNVNQLSVSTGLNPSTLYGIIKRNNLKVDLNALYTISRTLGVPLEYFVDEEDTPAPFTCTIEEEQIILAYRELNEEGKIEVNRVIQREYRYSVKDK